MELIVRDAPQGWAQSVRSICILAQEDSASPAAPETISQEAAPPTPVVTVWDWFPYCGTLTASLVLVAVALAYMSSFRRNVRELDDFEFYKAKALALKAQREAANADGTAPAAGRSTDPWSEAGRRLDVDEDRAPDVFPDKQNPDDPGIPPDDRGT